MARIPTKKEISPAALFMQSASRTLPATQVFVLNCIEQTLLVEPSTVHFLENTITINVRNQDDSAAFKMPIHIKVDDAALGCEILDACLSDKLRLKSFHVIDGRRTQQRLVLLFNGRVVGQLYCLDAGRSLKLEIKERPDALDMGNAVLALGRLSFNVHTPLGSAPADIHSRRS